MSRQQSNALDYSPTKRSSVTINAPKANLEGLPKRYFHPGELDVLVHLVRSVDARTMVEFGCNNGRTAAAILRNVSTVERYVGVDVPSGYQFACRVQRNEVPVVPGELALGDDRFELLLRDRGTLDLSERDLPDCDVVFIDGDHSEAAVFNDYYLAEKIVRPGGLVVFHDDNGLATVDVSRVLDDLCAGGTHIEHVSGTWLAFTVVRQ